MPCFLGIRTIGKWACTHWGIVTTPSYTWSLVPLTVCLLVLLETHWGIMKIFLASVFPLLALAVVGNSNQHQRYVLLLVYWIRGSVIFFTDQPPVGVPCSPRLCRRWPKYFCRPLRQPCWSIWKWSNVFINKPIHCSSGLCYYIQEIVVKAIS